MNSENPILKSIYEHSKKFDSLSRLFEEELSATEKNVMALTAQGKTAKQISEQLKKTNGGPYSEGSIRILKHRIYDKISAHLGIDIKENQDFQAVKLYKEYTQGKQIE